MNLYTLGNKLSVYYAVVAWPECSLARINAMLFVEERIHDALNLGTGLAVEHRYLCERPGGVMNNGPVVVRY